MRPTETTRTRQASPWATGWTLFASVMMIMLGAFHALMGLAALLNDEFFVITADYTYDLDITGWGWIHLIGGIIVFLAGLAVMSGATWARIIGITLAVISAVANFLWLPYYPVWSVVAIAIAVAVIWGLSRYERVGV